MDGIIRAWRARLETLIKANSAEIAQFLLCASIGVFIGVPLGKTLYTQRVLDALSGQSALLYTGRAVKLAAAMLRPMAFGSLLCAVSLTKYALAGWCVLCVAEGALMGVDLSFALIYIQIKAYVCALVSLSSLLLIAPMSAAMAVMSYRYAHAQGPQALTPAERCARIYFAMGLLCSMHILSMLLEEAALRAFLS